MPLDRWLANLVGVRFQRATGGPKRRLTYPLAGALFTACGLASFLAFRSALAGRPFDLAWMLDDLRAERLTHAYLTLTTLVLLVALGWLLGSLEDRLEAISGSDALTGLANRRRLQERLRDEVARTARYGAPLALLLVDVDGLKAINDGSGHSAGDVALRTVADVLQSACRSMDLVARIGGDEFAILAPSTTADRAAELGERVRASLARLRAKEGACPTIPTVSIGVADLGRAGAARPEALLVSADRALYEAKAAGRDRLLIAVPSPEA